MAWRDNPLGIVLDGTKNADLKKLKEEGISFVVIDGAVGPDKRNPSISKVVQDAYDNGMPVIMMFTQYPDQENYTVTGNIQSHVPMAQAITKNFLIHAYIINTERYWTGEDYEEYLAGTRKYTDIRWSTGSNISTVAGELVNTMKKYFATLGKSIPVMVRTSDGFVQSYSKDMAAWVGNNPFYLADWRYRMPNPDDGGRYTKYVIYGTTPTPVESVAVLREALPPVEAKNPLVPGANTPLKFWEFSGRRFVHPAVKDLNGKPTTASYVLFNGTLESMYLFFNYTPKGEDPGDTTAPGVPVDLAAMLIGSDVTVSWRTPGDADIAGYTVYRDGAAIHTSTDKLFYVDVRVPVGTYAYTVDAFDAAGNRSAKAPAKTVVVSQEPPDDPGDPPTPSVTGRFFQRLEGAISAAARAWLDFQD